MIPHQLPPTLEQRRALAECLAKANPRHELSFGERRDAIRAYRDHSWADEHTSPVTNPEHVELSKPYVGPFMKSYLDALSAAEREALCARGEPVEITTWQMLKEEYREQPAAFLAVGLVWLAVLGIGLVLLAVRQGWIQ